MYPKMLTILIMIYIFPKKLNSDDLPIRIYVTELMEGEQLVVGLLVVSFYRCGEGGGAQTKSCFCIG